jgi:hypothetical protein
MKTRCLWCNGWIVWSRRDGTWWHLETGLIFCLSGKSTATATRDVRLPLVDLEEADNERFERGPQDQAYETP